MSKSKGRNKSQPDLNQFIISPSPQKSINKSDIEDIDYPVFCFKYLQSQSIDRCKDGSFFFKFLDRLRKLSDLGWKEIRTSDRHSFGMEKIPIKDIIPQRPPCLTPDIEYLFAFRAIGDNRPFLGIQTNKIFHVIFIESSFGDIYNH